MKKINYILTGLLAMAFTSSGLATGFGESTGQPKEKAIAVLNEHGALINKQVDDFIDAVRKKPATDGDMSFADNIPKVNANDHAVKGEVDGVPTLVYAIKDDHSNGCARGMYILAQLYSQIPGSAVAKVTAKDYFNGEDKVEAHYIWKVRVCEGLAFQSGTGTLTAGAYSGVSQKCIDSDRAATALELTDQIPQGSSRGLMEKDSGINCLSSGDVVGSPPAE